MGLKGPWFVKNMLLISAYPLVYFCWVEQIKNTWINNNIKDLHPQLIYPTANRFTKTSGSYPCEQEYQEALVSQAKGGLRDQYLQKLNKAKGNIL